VALHFIHGDVGGVGKSLFAAALGEYLIGRGIVPAVVDADLRNANVRRYFNGASDVKASDVPQFDLRHRNGFSDLYTFLYGAEASDVVISLPANIGQVFIDNAGDIVDVATELERAVTVFWLMGTTPDSVGLLPGLLDVFASARIVQLVAVRRTMNSEFKRPRR
jgi:hypothetical protein